jgi:hypothetical protein
MEAGRPQYDIHFIALILGIGYSLYWQFTNSSSGSDSSLTGVIITSLFMGVIFGLVWLYLYAGLTRWVGRLLGGDASFAHMQIVFSWGAIPWALGAILFIPQIALVGAELFTTETPILNEAGFELVAVGLLQLTQLVLGIWGLILITHGIAEIQNFGFWKAFGSLLIAMFLPGVVFVIIILVIGKILN